eukprot:COSAG02_NODE_1090_length_14647_cov_122.569425_15_plen_230_part_00
MAGVATAGRAIQHLRGRVYRPQRCACSQERAPLDKADAEACAAHSVLNLNRDDIRDFGVCLTRAPLTQVQLSSCQGATCLVERQLQIGMPTAHGWAKDFTKMSNKSRHPRALHLFTTPGCGSEQEPSWPDSCTSMPPDPTRCVAAHASQSGLPRAERKRRRSLRYSELCPACLDSAYEPTARGCAATYPRGEGTYCQPSLRQVATFWQARPDFKAPLCATFLHPAKSAT